MLIFFCYLKILLRENIQQVLTKVNRNFLPLGLKRKLSVLSIKDKNEDADDIILQMICEIVVSRLNVVFLI